jgi:hypothetical protein
MFILWSIDNLFVVCLGLLSCWKIPLQPSLSLLVEVTRFGAKRQVLGKVHNAIDLNRISGSKIAQQNPRTATTFYSRYSALLCRTSQALSGWMGNMYVFIFVIHFQTFITNLFSLCHYGVLCVDR